MSTILNVNIHMDHRPQAVGSSPGSNIIFILNENIIEFISIKKLVI